MKPLRIGLVLDDSLDRPDGVQQYVLTLGMWLTRQGHEVHYLCGETKRRDLPHLHSLGRNLKVRFNHNRLSVPLPVSRTSIRHLLHEEQFDVLHVQMPYSPFLAHRLIRAATPETAIIGTFHIAPYSPVVNVGTRLLRVWEQASFQRFDDVLSVSSAAQIFAREACRTKSEIIPNALNLQPFLAAQPFDSYNDDTLNIVFLGRLVARKGCRHLLEAIARLKIHDLPDFRVIIVGDGPLKPELEAFTKRQSLANHVEFIGRISEADKPRYLAAADIAVFPSTGGESFGIVLLEAMAAARGMVLAGDNPGYRSVMGERPNQLFTATDSRALAAKLTSLLQNPQARREAHVWQKKHVKQFDIEVVGPRILTVYREALHPSGAA